MNRVKILKLKLKFAIFIQFKFIHQLIIIIINASIISGHYNDNDGDLNKSFFFNLKFNFLANHHQQNDDDCVIFIETHTHTHAICVEIAKIRISNNLNFSIIVVVVVGDNYNLFSSK